MLNIQREIPHLESDILFNAGIFAISNSTVMIFFIILLFAILGVVIMKKFKTEEGPSKFQVAVEMIYEGAVGLVSGITQDERRSKIIFPVVGSILIYIITANLLGLVPGLSSIEIDGHALFHTATADFSTTFGLAFAAIVVINLISIKEWGILAYIGKFLPFHLVWRGFRKGIGAGMISLVEFLVGVLDIIGELARIVSLSLRLFGNVYAGHVLTVIIFGALMWGLPAVWMAMDLFVGILQGVVFAALIAAYYMQAIKPDEEPSVLKVSEGSEEHITN